MDEKIKGDLILRDIISPEAKTTLVNTLLRIYRSATPAQLEAMVSKPRPFILIQDVEETKAAKLIEILTPHGVVLEFVASEEDWQLEAVPAAADPGHPATPAQPPVQPSPPPSVPPSSAASQSVKAESGNSEPTVPGATTTARRKGKPKKEKHPGSGKHSTFRTAARRVRIAILLLFLLGAVGMAWQVRNQTMTPGHIFSVAQDKLHTWGILTSTLVMQGDTDSDLLKVMYEPPPSVMSVKPEGLVAAYQELYAPRPDRRFLMAFDTLAKRWAHISGEDPQKYRARTIKKSHDRVSLELLRGRKVIHRTSLPLPTSFTDLMVALDQSLTVLSASGITLKPAAVGESESEGVLSDVRQLVDAVDPRFALLALDRLEEVYSREGAHSEILLEASRAYTMLCFLLIPDMGTRTDELAAEALAFLAIAKHGSPDLTSLEVEAFLAGEMGYEKHAVSLLEKSEDLGKSRRSKVLAAYMRKEVNILNEILADNTRDSAHLLGTYLHARLLREIGLFSEAEAATMNLLNKWPSYPAIIEVLYVGDLNLAKYLTVLYPLDILAFLESQASFQVFNDQSLDERFKALEGKSVSDVASLPRFKNLLEQWTIYGDSRPRLFIDDERAKGIFRIMYSDALYLRFNLLLDRWSKPEDAWNFALASAGDQENPLTEFMLGMVLREAGQTDRMKAHFRRVLFDADSRGRLSIHPYWYSAGLQPQSLLPLVYSQLDGRPSDRLLMGEILHMKFYDVDGSSAIYRECLDRNPHFFKVYSSLAQATGSDTPILEAVGSFPDSIHMLQIATGYLKKRGHDPVAQKRALGILNRAIELAPSKRSFADDKGKVLKNLGRYEEAVRAYTRWISEYGTADLSEVSMKASRAEALRLMGRPQEALLSMEGAELSYQAGAMEEAARCFEDLGMTKQAAEWFMRTAERYPTTPWIGASTARFLWSQGDDVAAAKLLNRFRPRTEDNPAWYADEFMEAFKTEPTERIMSVIGNLRRTGATDVETLQLAAKLALNGRLDTAFEISSTVPVVNFMHGMESVVISHDYLKRFKGDEEASRYFIDAITSQGSRMDLAAIALFKYGAFDIILDNIGDPDSYPDYPEYVWLTAAASWRALGGESEDWKGRLEKHYSLKSGMEPYFTVGRYLMGTSTREEVIDIINTQKRRVEVPYFLGLMARLEGDFEEANAWYQTCVLSGLEDNMEYHAALMELMNWTYLGTSGRKRKPADDYKEARFKLTMKAGVSQAL